MPMKKNRIFEFTIMLMYVCLGSFGVLISFTEAFEISHDKYLLYLVTGIFCVAGTTIVYSVKKHKKLAAIIVGVVGNFILLLLSGGKMYRGATAVLSIIERQLYAYLNAQNVGNLFVSYSQTEGVLFFQIIFTTIIIYGIMCCKKSWCTVIMMALGIGLPFMVGRVPENVSLICLVVVMLGEICSKNGSVKDGSGYKAGLAGIAAGILAFVIGITVIYRPLETVFHKNQLSQDRFNSYWSSKWLNIFEGNQGTGGVNDGQLGKIDSFKEEHGNHLKVWVSQKPEERIYLQGYIGTEYQGDEWESAAPDRFLRWVMGSGYTREKIRNLQYDLLAESIQEHPFMSIQNIAANPDYQYRPYVSLYESNLLGEGDTYVGLDGEKLKEYSLLYIPYEKLENVEIQSENIRQMEAAYESYVKEAYTDVSWNIRNAFRNEVSEKVPGTDVDEVIAEVSKMLAEQTSYTTSPGRTPRGEDFARYFYFENKKGYCSHYATVAALLFRMKDIPARYVSGYVIEPDEFQMDMNGEYVATVTGDSAHAWAEVYKSGKGWIPAETTPGYVKENVDSQEQPASNQNPEREEEKEQPSEEVEKEQPKEKAEKPEKKSPNEKESPEKIWLYVIPVILVVVSGCVFINRKRFLNRRKRKKGRKSYNYKIQQLFYKVFDQLSADKVIEKNSALDEKFVEKLCEKYMEISKEEIEKLLEIVYRANYGKQELEMDDYRFARRLLLLILEKKE